MLYDMKKITVIGLGYIGLPTAALFASRQIDVLGVDINPEVVELINKGKIHIVEPELDSVVHTVVSEGYLRVALKPEPADAFVIAVPTPFKDDFQPDLSFIKSAAQSIAPFLNKGNLIILESTSPVGTTEELVKWLAKERPDLTFPDTVGDMSDIRVAYCPERVLPGNVLYEMVNNDRIIGGVTEKCATHAKALYEIFVEGGCVITSARTAEMCKLTENSFRDVNIAFANELSIICDKLKINVWELIQLANRHPRVNILKPGPGVGGHCIAVDPWFIVASAPEDAKLIRQARIVNDLKPAYIIEKIKNEVHAFLLEHPEKTSSDVTISCLGLTFKADIDDLRESPAVSIVHNLAKIHTGPLLVVEPYIERLPKEIATMVDLRTLDAALVEADILVVLVDHKLFYENRNQLLSSNARLIDTRGICS